MNPAHANAQLGLSLARNVQHLLERQRTTSTRLGDQIIHDGEATGFVELAGAGEQIIDVDFPLTFVEKPVFTFGFELGGSSYLVQGDFPLGTATVAQWTQRQFNDLTAYVGARLAVVIVGLNGTGLCHFVFKGKSFSNPVGL